MKSEEQYGLSSGVKRDLPIEGVHFFTPLVGVVTNGFDMATHPAVDIAAPAYKHNRGLLKKPGDIVTAGTPIAYVGNTGSTSSGDHLHFELWYKGTAVDPTLYISF